MNHLLDIASLSVTEIESLLEKAFAFKEERNKPLLSYHGHRLATLFYENSTRTRVSFQIAAERLQLPVTDINLTHSSEKKGEIIEDTIRTLAMMGIDLFVLRHHQDKLPHALAEVLPGNIHIINAGDGMHAHPSQALLDLMTIREYKKDLSAAKITIIGNIRHSRVANSLQVLFAKMKVQELVMVAPPIWQPEQIHCGRVTSSLDEGLQDADVVICLRVQKERFLANESFDLPSYRHEYTLTPERFQKAKINAVIMHPGPVNRNVEIEDTLVDSNHSLILRQVENGVFMRMAILDEIVGGIV